MRPFCSYLNTVANCVEQLFLSDPDAKFSQSIGWADSISGRTGRYAIVVDHGKVGYAQIETERGAVKVRTPRTNTKPKQSRKILNRMA